MVAESGQEESFMKKGWELKWVLKRVTQEVKRTKKWTEMLIRYSEVRVRPFG